jgi:hypothetical protein
MNNASNVYLHIIFLFLFRVFMFTLQDNILNNTTTNSIIHTHIKIHVLTILYIYKYFKYFRRILVPWYLVNALMMTS